MLLPERRMSTQGKHYPHFSHRVHLDSVVNVLRLERWNILVRESECEKWFHGLPRAESQLWMYPLKATGDVPGSAQCMCTHTRVRADTLTCTQTSLDTANPCLLDLPFRAGSMGREKGWLCLYSKVQRTGFLCRSIREHHLPKKVSYSSHNVKRNLEKGCSALCNLLSALTRCFH